MLFMAANPKFAYLCQGKTRQSASDVAAHRLGQGEAYLTVREVLSEASTAADGVLSREPSGFYRCRYAKLGLLLIWKQRAVIVPTFDFVGMYFFVLLVSIPPGQILLSLQGFIQRFFHGVCR
jgi:hypothetical protein